MLYKYLKTVHMYFIKCTFSIFFPPWVKQIDQVFARYIVYCAPHEVEQQLQSHLPDSSLLLLLSELEKAASTSSFPKRSV